MDNWADFGLVVLFGGVGGWVVDHVCWWILPPTGTSVSHEWYVSSTSKRKEVYLDGGFKDFHYYFSNALKPPTRSIWLLV